MARNFEDIYKSYIKLKENSKLVVLANPTPGTIKDRILDLILDPSFSESDKKVIRTYLSQASSGEIEDVVKNSNPDEYKPISNFFRKGTKIRKYYGRELVDRLLDFDTKKNSVEENSDRSVIEEGLERQLKLKEILSQWKDIVLHKPIWDPVQLIFNQRDIDGNLYQPVSLSPLNLEQKYIGSNHGEMLKYQLAQRTPEDSLCVISIESILIGLSPWSVLFGVPGSGKTSTTKWILRQVLSEAFSVFEYAIYLPLKSLQDFLSTHPGSSLYEFFFEKYIECTPEESIVFGNMLREMINERTDSCLFLLDGLDEVDKDEREALINTMHKELSQNRVIITSRPSALYALKQVSNSSSYYDIAPLSPASVRRLVSYYCKLRNSNYSAADMLRIIGNNVSLQKTSITPFLLIITCEVIDRSKTSHEKLKLTPAWIFDHLVQLVQQEHDKKSGDEVTAQDIRLLVQFAEELCFKLSKKQLLGVPSKALAEARSIIKSRFLNEVSWSKGVFEFAHLRLQEYFGARAIIDKEQEYIANFIENFAFNPEWLEEACFVAGLSADTNPGIEPWPSLKKQLDWIEKERTGNGWLWISRIIAASGIAEGGQKQLGVDLRGVLIQFILNGHPLYEKMTTTLIEMDADHFINELVAGKAPDEVWEKIFRLIPLSVRERTGLLNVINNKLTLQWIKQIRGFGFVDEKILEKYRKNVREQKVDRRTLLTSVQRLGMAKDDLSVELLRPLVLNPSIVAQTAANALANIGGVEAANVLVDALIGSKYAIEVILRSNAEALQIIGALEPRSRDRLVDWLAEQHNPYPLNTKYVLMALNNVRLPTRGAKKTCQMLLSESLDDNLREKLVDLIPGIRDETCIEKLVTYALDNPSPDLQDRLFESIPFIPPRYKDLVDKIREQLEKVDNEKQLTLLMLLSKSYRHYPNDPIFAFVPLLFESKLRNDNKEHIAYTAKLWRIAKNCGSPGLHSLAWKDILSDINSLPIKSALLSYLKAQRITPNLSQIEQLKKSLVRDQENRALRSFIRDFLRYLISETEIDGSEILEYINNSFTKEMTEFFSQVVLNAAALSGKLIFTGNK